MTKSEQVLDALQDALAARLSAPPLYERNASLPTRISSAGYVALHDGDPGTPEVLLSPLTYIYQHHAEIDVVVDMQQFADEAAASAAFDAIKTELGLAIAADRTLGDLCEWVEAKAPVKLRERIEGAEGLLLATIRVALHYETTDPLA